MDEEDRHGYYIHWCLKSPAAIAAEQAKQLPHWQHRALRRAYREAKRVLQLREGKWWR